MIKAAVEQRLRMLSPYIEKWPQVRNKVTDSLIGSDLGEGIPSLEYRRKKDN